MFDNDLFEDWLDSKSQELVQKMGALNPCLPWREIITV